MNKRLVFIATTVSITRGVIQRSYTFSVLEFLVVLDSDCSGPLQLQNSSDVVPLTLVSNQAIGDFSPEKVV